MSIAGAGMNVRLSGESSELPPIHIMAEDYEVLADIVCGSTSATPGIRLLWRELQRAEILRTDRPPNGLIHLNSKVRYTDLRDPRQRTVRLISPRRRGNAGHSLSVASPVGAALIGLCVGDRFSWISPGAGVRMLRVDQVEADSAETVRHAAARSIARRQRIDELLSAR